MLSIFTTHHHCPLPYPKHIHKTRGKFLEVMDMFGTLIVVIVSWVYAYVQTYQICTLHIC